MACIHCAECVDACTGKMAPKGRKSLIGYFFGLPGKRGSGVRVNPLFTGILAVLSLAFLVHLASSRVPFDAAVQLRNITEPAILSGNGATEAYQLLLRNLDQKDRDLDLYAAAANGGTVHVTPVSVRLKPGSDSMIVPISLSVQLPAQSSSAPGAVSVLLTLKDKQSGKSIVKKISLIRQQNP